MATTNFNPARILDIYDPPNSWDITCPATTRHSYRYQSLIRKQSVYNKIERILNKAAQDGLQNALVSYSVVEKLARLCLSRCPSHNNCEDVVHRVAGRWDQMLRELRL
jgi:hypothetical protein